MISSRLKAPFLPFFHSYSDYSSFFIFLCKFHSPDTSFVRRVFFIFLPQPQGIFSCVLWNVRVYCSLATMLSVVLSAFSVAADMPSTSPEPLSRAFSSPPWQLYSLLTTKWRLCSRVWEQVQTLLMFLASRGFN